MCLSCPFCKRLFPENGISIDTSCCIPGSNFSFFSKNNLTRHFRVHSGEKAFSCHICSKAFSRRDSLNLYLRIHKGIKPHKCNHCTKCFLQNSSLTKHLRTHTNAKLFKCTFCSKAISRDTYKRYQRNHSVVEVDSP